MTYTVYIFTGGVFQEGWCGAGVTLRGRRPHLRVGSGGGVGGTPWHTRAQHDTYTVTDTH